MSDAEMEFAPDPKADPEAWFCHGGPALDGCFLITTWVFCNAQTGDTLSHNDAREQDLGDLEDHLLPVAHAYYAHSSPEERLKHLKKHGLEALYSDFKHDQKHYRDAHLIDVGIALKSEDGKAFSHHPTPRDLAEVLGIPAEIGCSAAGVSARLIGYTATRKAKDLYGIFNGAMYGFFQGQSAYWPPSTDCGDTEIEIIEGDTAARFFDRIAVSPSDIHAGFELFRVCGNDASLVVNLRERRAKKIGPIRFHVPGLIAVASVTLLGGKRKSGKSTLLTELATTTALGGGQWCGFDIANEVCGGLVLLFCGEDSQEAVHDRVQRMSGASAPLKLVIHGNEETNLKACLERYRAAKISLIVVDPSRKYYSGDEDGSDAPNELFNLLEQAAVRHRCAVVVSHHPRKDANPRNLAELAGALRGSGLFLDRPRTVLGLLRSGDETILGIPRDAGGGPLHNFPAELMFAGERRLNRDEESHRLVLVGGSSAGRNAGDELLVLSALDHLAKSSQYTTKSGNHGLFENWPKDIERLPRARVHATCEGLIASGKLILIDGGLSRPIAGAIA